MLKLIEAGSPDCQRKLYLQDSRANLVFGSDSAAAEEEEEAEHGDQSNGFENCHEAPYHFVEEVEVYLRPPLKDALVGGDDPRPTEDQRPEWK
ncbi:hypothetical protein SAY86_028137 [Trapa natans]|uniref:Uncharacterized protein n=1 Tax=Trapa natans TaxID=22666 RepID=A0AAN7RDD6_TRANT|nr:hypothetical protein SAY86_028137 [Trapa natans]